MAGVKQFIGRIKCDITRPLFVKQMIWVLAFCVVATLIILTNIEYLRTHYSKAVRPNDFFLEMIPKTNALAPLSDIVGRAGALIIIYVMWEERFRRVPKLIFLLGAMYILRSFAIILTPLGQIQPPAKFYSEANILAQSFYYGMFFSGHTASAFIQVFFIKGHRLRPYAIAIAIIMVFGLLASHAHYSIDIFGGFFVAYFFVNFDFMCFVPKSLREVHWMPWYTGEAETEDRAQGPEPVPA